MHLIAKLHPNQETLTQRRAKPSHPKQSKVASWPPVVSSWVGPRITLIWRRVQPGLGVVQSNGLRIPVSLPRGGLKLAPILGCPRPLNRLSHAVRYVLQYHFNAKSLTKSCTLRGADPKGARFGLPPGRYRNNREEERACRRQFQDDRGKAECVQQPKPRQDHLASCRISIPRRRTVLIWTLADKVQQLVASQHRRSMRLIQTESVSIVKSINSARRFRTS